MRDLVVLMKKMASFLFQRLRSATAEVVDCSTHAICVVRVGGQTEIVFERGYRFRVLALLPIDPAEVVLSETQLIAAALYRRQQFVLCLVDSLRVQGTQTEIQVCSWQGRIQFQRFT